MASTALSFELESTHSRVCQSISRSISPAAGDTKHPQIFRIDSTRTTSDKTNPYPHSRQALRRRPSLAADDFLPIGLLENASVTGHHLDTTFDSRTTLRRSVSCATGARNSMAVDKVQRWSGMTRTVSDWDGLRRVRAKSPPLETLC